MSRIADKRHEFIEKFKEVVWEKDGVGGILLPPLLFAALNAWVGLSWAVAGGFILGVAFFILRLVQGEPLWRALIGVAAIFVAAGLAWFFEYASAYFLPSLAVGGLTILTALISVVVKRPLAALTSYVARQWPIEEIDGLTTRITLAGLTLFVVPRPLLGWTTYVDEPHPLAWYWHSKVRPAYTEATWFWVVFFSIRLAIQTVMYVRDRVDILALISIVGGWPAVILLLVGSYRYGLWRLEKLGGPSAEEFSEGESPPWDGEDDGF